MHLLSAHAPAERHQVVGRIRRKVAFEADKVVIPLERRDAEAMGNIALRSQARGIVHSARILRDYPRQACKRLGQDAYSCKLEGEVGDVRRRTVHGAVAKRWVAAVALWAVATRVRRVAAAHGIWASQDGRGDVRCTYIKRLRRSCQCARRWMHAMIMPGRWISTKVHEHAS